MKLIDILARELKEWPEGVEKIDQSNVDGELYFDDVGTNLLLEIADGLGIAQFGGGYVTEADWQAAASKPEECVQSATEARESAIKDLMRIDDIYHEQAAAIYDAGYRKVSP